MPTSISPGAIPATLDRRILTVLAWVAVLLAVYSYRSADPDLWGHLCYGRLFLQSGGRIVPDPFAYTSQGRQWSTHEYLAQMALAQAYLWFGPAGLIGLKCLLAGLAVLCLYGCLRTTTDDPRIWAPLLMLMSQALGQWCQFRPQLFTYLFFAYFVLTLFRYLLGRSRLIWVLPLLLPLWVNLHGGFLAGIGAVGLALAGRVLQAYNREGFGSHPSQKCARSSTLLRSVATIRSAWPLLLVLLGCFAGSLLNPLGWRLWPYLATEFGHKENGKYLQEWQMISLQEQTWPAVLFGLVLGLLLLLTLLAQVRNRAPADALALDRLRSGNLADLAPWQWLLSCLPLAVMALQSQRHIPILVIWATPVLGLLAQAAASRWAEQPLWERTWLGVTGLAAIATLLLGYVVLSDPLPRLGTRYALGKTHPYEVMVFLRTNGVKGKLYAPLWWGSYFTWELYPNIRVAMDGRNVTLFAPEDVTDNLRFYSEPNADPAIPLEHGADYLVIPADSPVLAAVRADDRWHLVRQDDQASLFVPNTAEGRARVDKWLRLPPGDGEATTFIPPYFR